MSDAFKASLFATIIATFFGAWAWMFGLCRILWPAHPFFADLLLTVVALVLSKQLWLAYLAKR
jgi:hypothetical protein